MPVSFCDEFNVNKDKLEKLGVFNLILDVDTKVFLDPGLLYDADIEIFDLASQKINDYFSKIISLLLASDCVGDMYWNKADSMLKFKEITETCVGYSNRSTNGNAIGTRLRKEVLLTMKDLLSKGINDPILFQLLGVFQKDIGCDRVSDLVTYILIEDIIKYTESVLEKLDIPCNQFKINKKYDVKSILNPYNNKPILLLPYSLLTPLPIAECFDDIEWVCMENQRVRDIINDYVDLENNSKLSKDKILVIMKKHPEFVQQLINRYTSCEKKYYDFNTDIEKVVKWYDISSKYTQLNQMKLDFNSTDEDVYNVAYKLAIQFKNLIENKGLWKHLYDKGKTLHERFSQDLFFAISDMYCKMNNIDISREVNNGNGPVDFKLSCGSKNKVIVEVKLTSNGQLIHGLEKQIPFYQSQEDNCKAIYLVINNGNDKRAQDILDLFHNNDYSNIELILVDGTQKLSASKRN